LRRADVVADDDIHGAGEGEQFEPGEWVFGGACGSDSSVGQIPEGAQRRRGMTGLGGSDGGCCEHELGRRKMSMAPRSRSALRSEDALFLEVADHPR
jgi:hypothetical protein